MSKAFVLKEKREERNRIRVELEKIGDVLRKEARAMNSDEKTQFDKLKTDWVAVNDSIRTVEGDIGALDAILNQDNGADSGSADDGSQSNDDSAQQQNSRVIPGKQNRSHLPQPRGDGANLARDAQDKKLAFRAWARRQAGLNITREEAEACKRTGVKTRNPEYIFRVGQPGGIISRSLGVASTGIGGSTVAPDFSYALESFLSAYSNVRGVVGQFTTETGVQLPYPTEDDTGNSGALLAESTETAFVDDGFNVVNFQAYKYTSNGVLVSYELLNDSAFDLDSFIGGQIGIRIARAQGPHMTTGTGTGQPQGIITAAGVGLTSASPTAFTADELTNLAFSVNLAYRSDPSCAYMMHDSTVAYAFTLKDSYGRPLLRQSYRDSVRADSLEINGFPVYTNMYMDAMVSNAPAATLKHVLFGAMAKHMIRDVGEVRVRRLDERYAEKDQVGFVAFMRSDSRCINTNALKVLQQHS